MNDRIVGMNNYRNAQMIMKKHMYKSNIDQQISYESNNKMFKSNDNSSQMNSPKAIRSVPLTHSIASLNNSSIENSSIGSNPELLNMQDQSETAVSNQKKT